jgi:ABC-type branched-subunit amino acid transport system permease subunit
VVDFGSVLTGGLAQMVGPSAIFYALMAIGLNVHFGYTGLLNFGQIGFAAVGAYGLAVTVQTYEQPLWLGIVVGLTCGVVLAALLGLPTLRLRADYLAIVTIAAAEILRLLLRSVSSSDVTGGNRGLGNFSGTYAGANPFEAGRAYSIAGLRFQGSTLWAMVIGWSLVALCLVLVWLLVRSPWGRVLKAIREDEDAARALGKSVFTYKMQSLVLGGVLGSIGGMFIALANQAIAPDFFSAPQTFFAYAALVLGGAGRVLGPVVGAMLFWFLISASDTLLRQLTGGGDPVITFLSGEAVGAFRFVLVGALLALLVVFRPQGIFGDRKELQLDAR